MRKRYNRKEFPYNPNSYKQREKERARYLFVLEKGGLLKAEIKDEERAQTTKILIGVKNIDIRGRQVELLIFLPDLGVRMETVVDLNKETVITSSSPYDKVDLDRFTSKACYKRGISCKVNVIGKSPQGEPNCQLAVSFPKGEEGKDIGVYIVQQRRRD